MTIPIRSRRKVLRRIFVASIVAVMSTMVAWGAAAQSAVVQGKEKWLFPGWESHKDIDQTGIDRSIALIRSVKEQLAARKIDLVVMIAPMKAPFYQDKLLDEQKLSASLLARYAGLMTSLKQADIPTVNLMAVLKSDLGDKQSAFFRTDYHWTAWAAEASAKATARLIKEKWKLRGDTGDGSRLGDWANERRFGDLASNFMTEDQQRAVGREIFTVRRAPVQAAAGLTDDGQAPVHVVGNSFVQPYLGFPQALSADLDRRVSLTWNPGNVGPWATFLQYVASPDFTANPPQVVVWQFNEAQMHQGPDTKGQWEPKSTMAADEWSTRIRAVLGQ